VAPDKRTLTEASRTLGEVGHGHLIRDRQHVDYLRVFVSRPALVGRPLGDLELPGGNGSVVLQVRRGDTDLLARPELVLEFGDRVGLLTSRDRFPATRRFFGDSIKGTAEFSYISIGIGMAAGFLLGAIRIPLPFVGTITVGLAGVLIVGLVLGNIRRTGAMNWTIPLPANLVLRNLGLTLFLAQVGMASGPKFAATVAQTGFQMLGLGAAVLFALILPVMILGLFVYRLPFDEVTGMVAGACGNPAILAYANKLGPSDRPDLAYAMIFPGTTIIKILFVDIAAKLL
jgi:putative transport protein